MQRAQFTMEQRNFLALEYHKKRGTRGFKEEIMGEFRVRLPGVREPGDNTMVRIWRKQLKKGTINNCNSKSRPGVNHSGRPRTVRTPGNTQAVKDVMDRDAGKVIGDRNASPVNSSRQNVLAVDKSSWSRIRKDLKYHPFKPVRRHELKPGDLPRRLDFCHWILTRTDDQLLQILFSDEAMFELNGSVNSQNVRRYAPLKSSDPVNGGRPEHFTVDKPTFSRKIMVFCGVKRDSTFGLQVYQNETMNGPRYHRLLQYHVFPELRQWNGGNMAGLYWMQDGAPCHCTNANMVYLDSRVR